MARRKFSREFKISAVQLVNQPDPMARPILKSELEVLGAPGIRGLEAEVAQSSSRAIRTSKGVGSE